MTDISGTGIVVTLKFSTTFGNFPIVISQFADDSDPLDFAALQIADAAMGLNGDLLTWGKAVPVPMTLNVIPGSLDDLNLSVVGDANRVGQGKVSAQDVVSGTVVYPDGRVKVITKGKLMNYMPANSVASSMRLKSKPYVFMFQDIQ